MKKEICEMSKSGEHKFRVFMTNIDGRVKMFPKCIFCGFKPKTKKTNNQEC